MDINSRHIVMLLLLNIIFMTVQSSNHGIPKQVKRIYRNFKRGHTPETSVNTARYISAHKESVTSNGKLLFNLDAMHKKETLVKAEMYLHRKQSAGPIQVELFEVSPYYLSIVQKKLLDSGTKNWHILDITATVKKCTNTINTNNQLGVSFTQIDGLKPVNITRFLQHHSLPFIITYSNNTQTLESDQITGRSGLNEREFGAELKAIVDPQSGLSEKIRRNRRNVNDNSLSFDDDDDGERLRELDRKLNKIPGVLSHLPSPDDLLNELTNEVEFSPNTLHQQQQKVVESKGTRQYGTVEKVNQIQTGHTTVYSDITVSPKQKSAKIKYQLIPWPKVKHVSRKAKKRRQKARRIPTLAREEELIKSSKEESGCHRKPLKFRFDDIGWGMRIIEPKKFNAYYCSGQCEFPHSMGLQPTNHATLQSLLSSIKKRADVPRPCCVADKLSPVTLMFYDQYDNIVVKIYQDMSVESCSCR